MSSLPLVGGAASSKLQPINKAAVVLDDEKRKMQVSASAKSAKNVDDTGIEFRTANKVHTVCRESASQLARSFFMGERDELPVDSDTLPAFVRENDTTLSFPERLMLLLAYVEKSNKYTKDHPPPPISWMGDGQSFVIRDRHALTNDLLFLFFGPCKFASFCRKLHRWGFRRLHSLPYEDDSMVFGNDHFQRDKRNLMAHMTNSATAIARHKRALKKQVQQQQQDQLKRCNGFVSRQKVESVEQGQAPTTAKITQSGSCQEELETFQDECASHTTSDFTTGEEKEAGLEKSCCTLLDTRKVSDGKPTKAPSPADSVFQAPPMQSAEAPETGKAVFRTANNVRIVARGSASLVAGSFLHGIEDKLPLDNDDLPDFVRRHSTTLTFPQRLMLMMTYVDRSNEPDPPISWILDGTAIMIHNSDALTESILHLFFGPRKFGSFTRKLYRWGFRQVRATREEEGSKSGELAFANEFFQRDNKQLMVNMKSTTAVGRRRAIEKKLKLENSFQGNRGSYLTDGHKDYQQSSGEDSDSATSQTKEPAYLNNTAFGRDNDTMESDQYEEDRLVPSLKRRAANHNEMPGAAKRRSLMSPDGMLLRQLSGHNRLSTELNPSARQLAVGGSPLLQNRAFSRQTLPQASQPNILYSASQEQLLLQQRGLLHQGGVSILPSSSLSDLRSIQHLQNLQSIHQLQTLQQQQSLVIDQIRMQERERLLMELRMGAQNQLPTSHTTNNLLSSIARAPIPMGVVSLQGPPSAQQATNPGDPFFIL